MKQFTQKILTIGVALGSAILLSACGDDLSERPFVMTCKIQDRPYSAQNYSEAAGSDHTFDLHAGGLNLPTNDQITRRGGVDNSYFLRGYLSDEEGALEHSQVISLPMIDRSTGEIYRIERSGFYEVDDQALGRNRRVNITPSGWVDIEHYTMDSSGELTPVEFQLTTLNTLSRGRGFIAREADIGAQLPADANYAIYKYTVRDIISDNIDTNKTFTTYWAVPLEEKYRWNPKNWDAAQEDARAFSRYAYMVGNLNGSLPSVTYPLEDTREAARLRDILPERSSARSIASRTVPCLAGTHSNFTDFVSLRGPVGSSNTVRVVFRSGMSFVGFKESDLKNLPDNFQDREPPEFETDEWGRIYVEL